MPSSSAFSRTTSVLLAAPPRSASCGLSSTIRSSVRNSRRRSVSPLSQTAWIRTNCSLACLRKLTVSKSPGTYQLPSSPALAARPRRARQQQPPQARREPPEPPEPAAASHATWAVAAAGRGLTRAAEGGLRGRTRAAPRRRRTMNNTAKTASAISNADDRNSAKAPDRPMLESSAAMPRPAAMPAMGPSQREAPLLAAAPAVAAPAVAAPAAPARRWRRRCCRRPAAWWPGAAGSRCWTDGPRCCRRQRGAPRRQTKPSPAPRRKRRSALRRKPRKTEFGHGWCAPRTREGGARSAAPANFPYNNLNCIRITDKIPPHKFPVGKGSSEKWGISPGAHPRAARRCRRSD